MDKIPLFVRKFAVDAIEGAVAGVFALNVAFPTTVPDAEKIAVVVGFAVLDAVVSAARRVAPDFFSYVTGVFKTNG